MTEPAAPEGSGVTVGFSIQPGPQGPFIGIHWELPFTNIAIAVPLEWAEEMAHSFGRELGKMVDQAKQQKSGIVVAPASTLDTLKGK